MCTRFVSSYKISVLFVWISLRSLMVVHLRGWPSFISYQSYRLPHTCLNFLVLVAGFLSDDGSIVCGPESWLRFIVNYFVSELCFVRWSKNGALFIYLIFLENFHTIYIALSCTVTNRSFQTLRVFGYFGSNHLFAKVMVTVLIDTK